MQLNSIPSDSENIPKIAVTTSSISGEINIFGKTEGPVGGTIKYSLNNDSRIKVEEYGTEKHEFQLTEEQKSQTGKQNQQVVLGYGDNTLTFYAVPREEKQADDKRELIINKRELIINRVHEREGKDYALLIAVEDYSNPNKSSDDEAEWASWETLEAPIADAEALKEILESEYGFEIYPHDLHGGDVIRNPTKSEINELIDSVVEAPLKKDDQLIIFLAGHGYAQKLGDRYRGYFIPKPGENSIPKPNLGDKKEKFKKQERVLMDRSISHLDLRDRLNSSMCQNILVIMDTCFSGAFIGEIVKKRGMEPSLKKDNEAVQKKLTTKTRQFLTSGSSRQTVSDKQSNEKHSPFALQLFKALREGDGNKDSIVTFNELRDYFLPEEFRKITGTDQDPQAGPFDDHQSDGEFLLWKRKP